jgi:hypothetical protein
VLPGGGFMIFFSRTGFLLQEITAVISRMKEIYFEKEKKNILFLSNITF